MQNKKIDTAFLLHKRVPLFCFVVLCVCLLMGCSIFEFQAKKYVRYELNALCKDDLKAYMNITNSDEKAVQEGIEQSLQLEAEAFAAYFGVDALSDETTTLLKDFSKEVYSYSKYKVKNQKKTKNGYKVTVAVYPLLFHELSPENVDAYVEEFNQKAENSEYLYLSDALYQQEFVTGLLKVYEKELENVSYGDKVTFTVEIIKKGKHAYITDLSEVESALIAFQD